MLWRAIEMARNHESFGRVRVVAIALDKKGRILAAGGNDYKKSSTVQARFAAMVDLPEKCFLHAELKTLTKALRNNVKIKTLHIARVDRNGSIKDGKPCPICTSYIQYVEKLQKSKIEVFYTTEIK